MFHRTLCGVVLLAGLAPLCLPAETITLSGPQLKIEFETSANRLRLVQMRKGNDAPLLYRDQNGGQPGAGPTGNPFAVVIRSGPHQGISMPDSFHILSIRKTRHSLLAYLAHDSLPLQLVLKVDVEGSVATWRGQVLWNGEDEVELDVYLPLLSRVRFASGSEDRLLAAEVSGMTLNSLGTLNFTDAYVGSLSAPVFLVEGGGRGLAVVDGNRAEFAEDPGASALRGQVVGNRFPISEMPWTDKMPGRGGADGPFLGIRYTRRFRPVSSSGGKAEWDHAEKIPDAPPVQKLGDAIDVGPVRTYAYTGTWKQGALWARRELSDRRFRTSPAAWYRNTTFISEDMGDQMVKAGLSFHDYPKILAGKQRLGSDFFTIPGFSVPEILGSSANFLNRGDYFFAADNLGGLDAERRGISALHRQNGHLLYYVEGLIVWKRSRIGRTWAKDWAIMNEDGTYSESYRGFYDMCPAVPAWQEWFGKTAAAILRSTGVDGFFIDSLTATNNHRCFNPAHHHPHPDVWTWGVRQFLRRVRQEVDAVNPEAVLFTEGEADLAREFTDGFITHSAFWNHGLFTVPFTRFLYPGIRAFESWGYGKEPQKNHIFNAVNGERIYAHSSSTDLMAPISLETRQYDDAFPEITDAPMSLADVRCSGCLAAMFEGEHAVITAGNATGAPVTATLSVPGSDTILFDRVSGDRIPVQDGTAVFPLKAWGYRAFELRP